MKTNRATPRRTSLTALLSLALTLAFCSATAAAFFDNEIHLIPAPPLTRDAGGATPSWSSATPAPPKMTTRPPPPPFTRCAT